MKILIVDDNRMMRMTMKLIFHSPDNLFAECDDGSTAVTAFKDFKPDLVLMDLKMKQMDGITATRMIRNEHPNANIIIVTDFDDETMRLTAANAGASGYVMKEHLMDLQKALVQE